VASVALKDIRRLARLYADSRPGGGKKKKFIGDEELNGLVNHAIRELYELLVRARGHEYFETVNTSLSTAAGVATVNLPADHFQLLSLALRWSAKDIEPLDALEAIDDRAGLVRFGVWGRDSAKAFRMRQGVIEFFPTPTSITALELRYVPAFTDLATDTATFDSVHGWEKLVALRAALEMLTIGGDATSGVQKLYDKEYERVEEQAGERAAAHPKRIRDVVYEEGRRRGSWRRLGGVP
jgi:hypothetical protein